MTIAVGDKIPDVTLRQKGAEGIDALSTDDVFKGKKVVHFGVPGAFANVNGAPSARLRAERRRH